MSPPTVAGPRDLPALRDWLAREWAPGASFAASAWTQLGVDPREPDPTRRDLLAGGEVAARWNRSGLARAALWWVSADMVDLVEASSAELPPIDLTRGMVPTETAFVVFARPLQGLDALNDETAVMVDGVMWDRAQFPNSAGTGTAHGVSLAFYRRVVFDDGMTPAELEHFARTVGTNGKPVWPVPSDAMVKDGQISFMLHGEMWLPLGRSDWAFGEDWSAPPFQGAPEALVRSQAEDRRWMAVLWSLATQPNIVDLSHETPARPEARRAQRAGYSYPAVRVVDVRRTVYEGAGLNREPVDTPTGRRYRVRWPVAGHWRKQPYGPGRAYRRLTYIAPYIKGPEGAPLRSGARVHVLRGEPDGLV